MKIHELILGIVVFMILLACVICDRLFPSGGRSGSSNNDDGSELLNILSVRTPEDENQPAPFSQRQQQQQAWECVFIS